MNHTEFAVSRFGNRNGVTSWRVSGSLHGIRIRRNFKTREEAAAERAVLEIKALQIASGLRPVATTLSQQQVREAEVLFEKVSGKPHPLSFYVDFALTNYREPQHERKLSDAIADYVAAREREREQGQLSISQSTRIRRDLRRLERHFPGVSVAELTVPALIGFCEGGKASMKTYNNRRGIVSTFLKYGFSRGWISENPLLKVPHHRIRRRGGVARTLSADQARQLMEYIETFEGGRWVPYFALCLFAGIRPSVPHGEITKLRPEAVHVESGVISVAAEVSKVREPRKVTIQPNLAAWLGIYPLKKFPIIVPNFYQRRTQLAKKFGLSHDVLRHTFISMFVAKFRSMGEAALQAGNSESIIRKHYLDLKSKEEAEKFWGILPQRAATAAGVTPFPVPPDLAGTSSAEDEPAA